MNFILLTIRLAWTLPHDVSGGMHVQKWEEFSVTQLQDFLLQKAGTKTGKEVVILGLVILFNFQITFLWRSDMKHEENKI